MSSDLMWFMIDEDVMNAWKAKFRDPNASGDSDFDAGALSDFLRDTLGKVMESEDEFPKGTWLCENNMARLFLSPAFCEEKDEALVPLEFLIGGEEDMSRPSDSTSWSYTSPEQTKQAAAAFSQAPFECFVEMCREFDEDEAERQEENMEFKSCDEEYAWCQSFWRAAAERNTGVLVSFTY